MDRKFKVGDRVMAIKGHDNGNIAGKFGKVLNASILHVIVEFDSYICGHSANGLGTQGHCWGVPLKYLVSADNLKQEDYFSAYGDVHKVLDRITVKQRRYLSRRAIRHYVVTTTLNRVSALKNRFYYVFQVDKHGNLTYEEDMTTQVSREKAIAFIKGLEG